MYLVSGFNLFRQWFAEDEIIKKFSTVSLNFGALCCKGTPRLICITWSYNIFQYENEFFVSGVFSSETNSVLKLNFPKEIQQGISLGVIGNDHSLILYSKSCSSFWKISLSDILTWNWKKLPKFINAESSPVNIQAKKYKKELVLLKIIAKADMFTCLTSSGTLYEIPQTVDTTNCIGKICNVVCGYEHTIALTDEGKVYTWGNGRRCQLGHGDLNNIEVPLEVEAIAGVKIVKVCAGGWHCLALSESGDVYSWGWNDSGQLGIYSKESEITPSHPIPTLVDFYNDSGQLEDLCIKDIDCGSRHSAVVASDNSVWTTGLNKYGQLALCPKEVPSLTAFRQVYKCESDCTLICGPWATVIHCD